MDKTLILPIASGDMSQPELRLSLWDFGGQEEFYVLHHLYLTRFSAYVVLFNMEWLVNEGNERNEGLGFLRFWLSSIATHTRDKLDGSLPPIILVGTHKDKVISF